jgi:hypothetical protein
MEQIVANNLPQIKQLMLQYWVERAFLSCCAAMDTMNDVISLHCIATQEPEEFVDNDRSPSDNGG